jgi:ribosomal protein L37AE/L43A
LSFRPVASIESIRKLVAEAEAKSSTICQGCGQPAEMRNDGGYWRVLCDPCEAKRISERNL